MNNEDRAQPSATARSVIGYMVGRRMIAFTDPPTPAPKPGDPPPPPVDPPKDPPKDPPVEKTPEQIKEEKDAADLELRWKGLKLPEKSTLDATLTERTVAKARELGLSPEHAQSTLDFVAQEAESALGKAIKDHSPGGAEWNKQVEQWEKDALKDAELGANSEEKLQAAVTKARSVLEKYFPKSVAEYLTKTGFGSRPDVIKGFLAIAKAAGEGTFDQPKVPTKMDVATKFYGEEKSEAK